MGKICQDIFTVIFCKKMIWCCFFYWDYSVIPKIYSLISKPYALESDLFINRDILWSFLHKFKVSKLYIWNPDRTDTGSQYQQEQPAVAPDYLVWINQTPKGCLVFSLGSAVLYRRSEDLSVCFIATPSQPISSLVGIPHRPRTWISHGLAHIVRLAELNSLEQFEQGPV